MVPGPASWAAHGDRKHFFYHQRTRESDDPAAAGRGGARGGQGRTSPRPGSRAIPIRLDAM